MEEVYLKQKDAATYIGFSTKTIQRRIKDGTIKTFKIFGKTRIPKSELNKLIKKSS